ncbi:hypothetical protein, partial [Mycoplasmopsis bovis]|uniref:hypothetical protein n=1 Tax=Mycoplasmopsis bovis TaxID=28903 RepID=UPI0015EF1A1A
NAKSDKERSAIQNEYNKSVEREIQNSTKQLNQTKQKAISNRVAYYDLRAELKEAEKRFKRGAISADEFQLTVEKIADKIGETSDRLQDKSWTDFGFEGIRNSTDVIAQLEAHIRSVSLRINEYDKAISENRNKLVDANIETVKHGRAISNQGEAAKKFNTELKEQNEYLSKNAELLFDINNLIRDGEIEAQNDRIQKAREEALRQMELTGMPSGNLGKIKSLIDARADMEEQSIKASQEYRINQAIEADKLERENALKAIEENRAELLKQDKLTNDARLKIEASYQAALAKLKEDNFKRDSDLNLEILKIERES